MSTKVFVFGAASAIAERVARLFAEQGADLFLVARDSAKLEGVRDDLLARGATSVAIETCDGLAYGEHESLVSRAWDALDGFNVALIAHGTLPDQAAGEGAFEAARYAIEANYLSQVSLLLALARHFEIRGAGSIAVVSSVAGDRGRRSNYIYGSAKSALSVFLQGLRLRLLHCNVNVLTVKPGFVDTPMTQDIPKGFLWAQPARVAGDIYAAIRKKKGTLYTPWYWRWIMVIIRAMPERLLSRLGL